MDKYPRQLSGGMRQRVSLIRTLVHDPSLLLMDEPFGALDALTRLQVRMDLEALWLRRRPTVLFITHSVEEAVGLSDRILVMSPSPGEVVEEIQRRPAAAAPDRARRRAGVRAPMSTGSTGSSSAWACCTASTTPRAATADAMTAPAT